MAQIADYTIVTDSWFEVLEEDTIEFNVPSNIDKGARSILGFMIDIHHNDDAKVAVRLNGTQVWNWSYVGNVDERAQFFQEVVSAGLLKAGANKLRFRATSDEGMNLKFSDVVFWWQANI